jgi:uncharacterized protein (DUF1015 family)
MARPTYDELLQALDQLMSASLAVNDRFAIREDHAVYEGGMNQVEHLREVVNDLHNRFSDVLYPADTEDELE